MKTKKILTALTGSILALAVGMTVYASSHREAPLTSGDPKVDATDLYAFVSPDNASTVTLIANYIPDQNPAGGPNFYSFDDTALYEIKVDNNGDAMPDVTYQFRFKTTIANPNTFLYNTGAVNNITDSTLNQKQTYTLTRIANGSTQVLGTDLPVAPANVGTKSTPNYAQLQAQSIQNLANGIKVFVGPVDDPFFVDLGGIFDLLSIRKLPGNMGGGVNALKGANVHSIAVQVPISQLTSTQNVPAAPTDAGAVIGVWTTASRQSTKVLAANPTSNSSTGDWVQVSRLGSPLVNEVVVPLGAKDLFNGSNPKDDAQFANGVADPELSKLMKAIYNINVPPQGAFGSATQRDDLEAIFLTGIPGLTKPTSGVPSEMLRLNVAVPPTANPNKLGVIAGDKQGYPNGRRLADDVVDISLRAVAGAAYPLFHPSFMVDSTGAQLGDGVDANDVSFRSSFPYTALPHDGISSTPRGDTKTNPSDSMSTGSNSKCMINVNLTLGSRGQDVTCLQTYLIAQELLGIDMPTGYFGELTRQAVIQWQMSAGVSPTVGYFGTVSRASFNVR